MGVAEIGKKLSAKQKSALDFSSKEEGEGDGATTSTFVPTQEEEEEWDEEVEGENNSKSSWFGSAFKGALESAMNNKTLTDADLKPALEKVSVGEKEISNDHQTTTTNSFPVSPRSLQISSTLVKNNVNPKVADKIMGTVRGRLEGAKGGWNTETIVKDAVEEALERILQGSGSVDLLSEALSCGKKPYKIAFCGINGVGKVRMDARAG